MTHDSVKSIKNTKELRQQVFCKFREDKLCQLQSRERIDMWYVNKTSTDIYYGKIKLLSIYSRLNTVTHNLMSTWDLIWLLLRNEVFADVIS